MVFRRFEHRHRATIGGLLLIASFITFVLGGFLASRQGLDPPYPLFFAYKIAQWFIAPMLGLAALSTFACLAVDHIQRKTTPNA